MSVVYQTEMVLRFIGYSAEEIESMDMSSIHRVLAFKDLLVTMFTDMIASVLGEIKLGDVGGGGDNYYPMSNAAPGYRLENPFE